MGGCLGFTKRKRGGVSVVMSKNRRFASKKCSAPGFPVTTRELTSSPGPQHVGFTGYCLNLREEEILTALLTRATKNPQ